MQCITQEFKRYIIINSNYKNRKNINNLTHTPTHFQIHLLVEFLYTYKSMFTERI